MHWKISIALLLAACATLVWFTLNYKVAYAHGGGVTLTATTSAYLVDVDYSSYAFVSGDPGRFDFKLFSDEARTKPVAFTQVWARVVRASDIQEGDTIFSGWIARATFGSTGMSIQFPKSGPYTLLVRYNDGDRQIIEATLPFTVEPGREELAFHFAQEFWTGLVCGSLLAFALIAGMYAIRRRR